ncbi:MULTISPECIES: hypothetical protein [unclassified Streptomyces]|uniref:hypothetical protein n=1 Tax=unclassified Streptomyces TaxID=2593676 RepID=UPI0040429486
MPLRPGTGFRRRRSWERRPTLPLASVNESIDAVLRGDIKARIVFDLDAER